MYSSYTDQVQIPMHARKLTFDLACYVGLLEYSLEAFFAILTSLGIILYYQFETEFAVHHIILLEPVCCSLDVTVHKAVLMCHNAHPWIIT